MGPSAPWFGVGHGTGTRVKWTIMVEQWGGKILAGGFRGSVEASGRQKKGTYCVSEPLRLTVLYCGCHVDHEVTPSNSAPLLNPLVIVRRGSLVKEGKAILWAERR